MDIRLVPYTWSRHLHLALVVAAANLLAWWLLAWLCLGGAPWLPANDGTALLVLLGATSPAASIFAEAQLKRTPPWRALGRVSLAFFVGGLYTWLAWLTWKALFVRVVLETGVDPDGTLVSLRHALPGFLTAGMGATVGAVVVRRMDGLAAQLGAGPAAGLVAAGLWYQLGTGAGSVGDQGLYLSGALGSVTFGATFGLLGWGLPHALYRAWVRVLTDTRLGVRIPVDGNPGTPRERFVGHFPRGMDLYLPAAEGVNELQLSVLTDGEGRYRARGLTQQSTRVRRFLEKVQLAWSPRRPAPFETPLGSGDRLWFGDEKNPTVVEFLVLPREEEDA